MNTPRWNNQSINIQTLSDYVKNSSYDINPEHQRNVVHNINWKKELINSVFTTGLIPTTYWHIKGSKYINLDGKQRISTLIEYKNNIFQNKDNKYFKDLDISEQDKFNMFTINLGVCDRELSLEEIHMIFEKLQIVKKTSLGEVLNSTFNCNLKNSIIEYIQNCKDNNDKVDSLLLSDNNRFGFLEIIGWTIYFYKKYNDEELDYTLEQDNIITFWNNFDLSLEDNKIIFNNYKNNFNKFIEIFIDHKIPYFKNKTTIIPLFYIIIKYSNLNDKLSKYISKHIDNIKNKLKNKVNASHSACKERIDLIEDYIKSNKIV